MPARLLLLLLLFAMPACSGLAAPRPEGPLAGEELVDALREGGFVLYLRHTETTESGVDDLASLGDCAAQRKLTDAGRQDAREIGDALDALEIPVARVVASPFCRTVETAELAFGRTDTDPALLALASIDQDPERQDAAKKAGARLIATVPPDGANTVLVGHISNVGPITGAEPEEGGTIVFRPDADGGFRLVGEMAPQGWQRLAGSR